MNKSSAGFSLIELMVVAAVIGLLAAIALPAYQDYLIRSRIVEGLSLSAQARIQVGTAALTQTDLTTSANVFNNQNGGLGLTSKYVSSTLIDLVSGEIEITFNSSNIGSIPPNSSIIYTPYVQAIGGPVQLAIALSGSQTGVIDWGCASGSNNLSAGRLLPLAGSHTSVALPAKYAPSECR